MKNDEIAEDVKPDLLVKPNFPDLVLKPSLPHRTYSKPELVTPEKVIFSKAANHKGAMVALRIPPVAARRIAMKGGEPADDLHVTLVYLGDADDIEPGCLDNLHKNLARVARHLPALTGTITGCGRFRTDEGDVLWAGLDSPDLPELRHLVLQAVKDAAITPPKDHGFTPHITLAYVDEGEGEDSLPPEIDVTIKYLTLCVAGREFALRLTGEPDATTDQYEPPQTALPESTFSMIQEPKGHAFKQMEQLEEWAQDKGDVIVRADVGGPFCVIVKKGNKVSVAVEDHDGEEIRLDDLIVAMKRIHHDYILYGWLGGIDLDGNWVTDPDGVSEMLTAEEVISPRFMPCDLLAMDGDLSKKPARERLELMRVLGAQAGSHWVMPMQAICPKDEDLEDCVDSVMRWKPSEGKGLEAIGVTVVRADSGYTHGATDDEAQLSLKTQKAWSEEAREASLAARRARTESARQMHPEAVATVEAQGHRIEGMQEDANGGHFLLFTDPQDGTTLAIYPDKITPESVRAKVDESRASFGVGKNFVLKYNPDEARDENGKWTGGGMLYHSTDNEEAGKAILRSGAVIPQAPDKAHAAHSMMAPVKGHVYLARDKAYAQIYALGGDVAGSPTRTLPEDYEPGHRYGYVFEIDPKDLKGKIRPDEDMVGDMLADAIRSRGDKPFSAQHQGADRPWLYDLAKKHLTPNQFKKVEDGMVAYWAVAGKKLIPHMSPAQLAEVTEQSRAIAHEGPAPIKRAWRLDKTKAPEMDRAGKNFEQVAEPVEVTRKEYAFGAGPGAGTERPDWRKHLPDESGKPNFLEPEEKMAVVAIDKFGTPVEVEKEVWETEPRDEKGKWTATGMSADAKAAVEGTPGAKADSDGLHLDVTRHQNPEQAGRKSVRTGVFFLPELKSPWSKHYVGDKTGYGGSMKVQGRITVKNPMMVKASTGGHGPEIAYDAVKGKLAYDRMRGDVLKATMSYVLNPKRTDTVEKIKELLQKYEGDPSMAEDIFQHSQKGNLLAYALQEHIVAHALRKAGYDAIVSYSKHQGKPRLAEVFDLSRQHYPQIEHPGKWEHAKGAWTWTERDGGVAAGTFGTAGTSGIIAPQQGVFRKPRRSRSVNTGAFLNIPIDKDEGLNYDVSSALTLVSTTPRSRKKDPNARDAGGPLFPSYPGPESRRDRGMSMGFTFAQKDGPPDEARDESGKWTGGGTAVATPRSSVDEWEQRFGKPGTDPERYKVRMRDASGETLIHPNGDVYSGAPHAVLARALGLNVDEALGKGYVRGSDSWGGHVSAQFDLKNPRAQESAMAYLREHGKGSDIMVDDRMPEDQKTMPATAYFTQPAALGKALRYIQSGGADKSEISKDMYAVSGGGAGDGDSFAVGPGAVGGHRFVVGRLKDGEWVTDPDFKRVNPYEALFLRRGVDLVVQKYITGHGNAWTVHAESGKVLGHHGSKASAVRQLRAIEWHRAHPTAKSIEPPDARKPRKFPDVGADMGYNDTYDRKEKAGPEDEPRDESGKWTAGGGHQPMHFDFDKGGWTTHDGAPVYHGTTDKAVKQILKEGLLASKSGTIWASFSKKGYTYLGDDENIASQWAHDAIRQETKNWRLRNDASEPEPRLKAALIEIVVPKEHLGEIEPDRHFRLDSDTARTLQYKGDIKPEWITHAWVMKPGEERTLGPKDTPDAWKQIKAEGRRMIACLLLPEPRVDKSARAFQIERIAKAKGTVAIDFDGTVTVDKDGTENPKMRRLVEDLTDRGVPVTIFTARDVDEVKEWLAEHDWPALPVTNEKSSDFSVMLDDRAVHFDPTMLNDDTADKLSGFKTWWEKSVMLAEPDEASHAD